MKNAKLVAMAIIASMSTMLLTLPALAEEPYRIKTTAYTSEGGRCGTTTATGEKVREGIIAARQKDLGKAAFIWKDEVKDGKHIKGEFIGIFEVQDTGGKPIEDGYVVDVYKDTYQECVDWMEETNGRVWIQFVEGKG